MTSGIIIVLLTKNKKTVSTLWEEETASLIQNKRNKVTSQSQDRKRFFYDLPNHIKSITTESHYSSHHRHEIQQPPSPPLQVVSWVMHGLAGLAPLYDTETYSNGLGAISTRGAGKPVNPESPHRQNAKRQMKKPTRSVDRQAKENGRQRNRRIGESESGRSPIQ